MTKKRLRRKWTITEELKLQREYELEELTIQEIAEIHKRTEEAIMCKLQKESIIDSWLDARGYQEFAKSLPVIYDQSKYVDILASEPELENEQDEIRKGEEEGDNQVVENEEVLNKKEEEKEEEEDDYEEEETLDEATFDDELENEQEDVLKTQEKKEEKERQTEEKEEQEEEFFKEDDETNNTDTDNGNDTANANEIPTDAHLVTPEEEWVHTNQQGQVFPSTQVLTQPAVQSDNNNTGILSTIFSYFRWR